MSRTTLDLDDEALAQTMALAGVRTKSTARDLHERSINATPSVHSSE